MAQQPGGLPGRHRPAKIKTLDAPASGANEKFQLCGCLDTFGDNLDAEFTRQANRCTHDGRAARIAGQAAHELLRDLDAADTIDEQIFE